MTTDLLMFEVSVQAFKVKNPKPQKSVPGTAGITLRLLEGALTVAGLQSGGQLLAPLEQERIRSLNPETGIPDPGTAGITMRELEGALTVAALQLGWQLPAPLEEERIRL